MAEVLLISLYEIGRQPFGLASAAAWLRREGADVRCVDLSVEDPPTDERLASPSMVGIHLPMHTATRMAIPLIQRIKRVNPDCHIFGFGLYAALNAKLLQELGVLTLVSGEFETRIVEVYRELETGGSPSPSAVVSLARQPFVVPDRSSLPALSRYARLRVADDEERLVGYTEASRGCKHRCRHCPVVPVYDGRFRVVDLQTVLADVEQQLDAGAQHITFGDPDFWNGPTHAHAIVDELHRRHPDVTYDVTIKVEHLLRHSTQLRRLRDTGCTFVTTAVESVDDAVLALLEKGHTRADFIRVVELSREVGLDLVPTFVAFTPWTTLHAYIDLLRLLADLDLVEHVAPVQLAIRLLIPSGSRLLEVPSVRRLAGPLDHAALCHPWQHGDSRMDELQRTILRLAQKQQSRANFFSAAWAAAHERHDSGARAPMQPPADRRYVPRLTEPWYC